MSTGTKSPHSSVCHMLFLGLFLVLSSGGNGWAEARKEYAVKAAFVYNFVKFSTWIGSSAVANDGTFDLYVVGDPITLSAFLTIDGKTIDKHLLQVHFKTPSDSFDGCDILFISRDIKRATMLKILDAVKGKPILTIGEVPDFARLGGVINLVTKKEGGVRFEICRSTAQQQQVEISSRILRLATLVDSTGSQEKGGQR